MRKAKILATLGPASATQEIIESMLSAGMSAARINMSHGERSTHAETIRIARAAATALDKPLSVLVDLSGPKIRTKTLDGGQSVGLSSQLATSSATTKKLRQTSISYRLS